jgi:arginine deiminase
MRAGARAEWEPLREVMVHEPGIEVFFALLSPSAHLYERFFNLDGAKREHSHLCEMLHNSYGVRVSHLKQAVRNGAIEDPLVFSRLVSSADRRMERQCIGDACHLPRKLQEDLDKPVELGERDPSHLIDIVILNPNLVLTPCGVHTELRQPLYNLYFMRDQQAATDKGMVQSRMAEAQRSGEVDLCGIALKAVAAEPIMQIRKGRFEGGDFMPAGKFALVGTGSRTNGEGVNELLSHLSFDEVAVVHQPEHPLIKGYDPMVSMHLDTYFNIAADGVAVGNPLLLEKAAVEVFHRMGDGYERDREIYSLDRYIREKEFECIEITTLEQLCYASNFLCVRHGECISPDTNQIAPFVLKRLEIKARANPEKYSALLRQAEKDYNTLRGDAEFFPHKKGVFAHGIEMNPLHLTNATGGYGGAHCMTCVLRRG